MLAAILACTLLVTSCSGLTNLFSSDTPDPVEPAAAVEVEEVEAETPSADGTPQALQDLWFITRMQAVDADGESTDVGIEVLNALKPLADEPVALNDELRFHPVPQLQPAIIRPTGEPRTEVEVVAGLFEAMPSAVERGVVDDGVRLSLGVIAGVAQGEIHVSAGDRLFLQLFDLPPLTEVDVVLVDYAFGHSLPPKDGTAEEATGDQVALLAERFAAGRIAIGGPENAAEGEVAIFTGVPFQRDDSIIEPASHAVPNHDGGTEIVTAGFTGTGTTTALALNRPGGGGGGGSAPFKGNRALAEAAISALVCLGIALAAGPAGGVFVTVVCTAIGALGVVYIVSGLLEKNQLVEPPGPPSPDTFSHGDPHLVGFTGKHYSIHAVGEFIAVRDESVEVQVRMDAVSTRAASNTALAARLGDQRVTIDPARKDVLWVDGEPSTLGEYEDITLAAGGSIARSGSLIDVHWPGGAQLRVHLRGRHLDYHLGLGDETAQVEGLHGTVDGRLLFASGEEVEANPDHDRLREFADTWRITDEESLFDYGPGESTATFTDLNFPHEEPTVDSLDPAAVALATTVCERAGLVGATLQNCIFDVAVTGDTTYAWSAVHQQVLTAPESFPRTPYVATTDSTPTDATETAHPVVVWQRDVESKYDFDTLTMICPPLPAGREDLVTSPRVWGTDIYSADSAICPAAVHAGVITTEGGEVKIERRPDRDDYEGTTRNGVTTRPWKRPWSLSYVFID